MCNLLIIIKCLYCFSLLHSFVLNTDDKKIRDLFSASEWQEILETNIEGKEAPTIDSDLLRHIARYRKVYFRNTFSLISISLCIDAKI